MLHPNPPTCSATIPSSAPILAIVCMLLDSITFSIQGKRAHSVRAYRAHGGQAVRDKAQAHVSTQGSCWEGEHPCKSHSWQA